MQLIVMLVILKEGGPTTTAAAARWGFAYRVAVWALALLCCCCRFCLPACLAFNTF